MGLSHRVAGPAIADRTWRARLGQLTHVGATLPAIIGQGASSHDVDVRQD
jgi:hypothetical protein